MTGVRRDDVGALGTVPEHVVHQHEQQHRLDDRHRPQPDAGIVPAGRHDFGRRPATSTVRPGTWMLEVGLNETCTITPGRS